MTMASHGLLVMFTLTQPILDPGTYTPSKWSWVCLPYPSRAPHSAQVQHDPLPHSDLIA